MIMYFAWNNMKLRFKGSYLGLLWTALEPLFIFGILFLVMTTIRDVQREEFGVYLIVGVLFYHLFAKGTISGMTSLVQNGGILKSLNIEKEIFPVISTGTVCYMLIVHMGVLFGLMSIFNFVPSESMILLPVVLALFLVLILGVSYFLSILFGYLRDVQPIWSVLIYALLFISPIFWYVNEVDGVLLGIQQLNPLGQIIELAHKIIVFGEIPEISEWVYPIIIVFGILFSGYALFKKFEDGVVENL